MELCPGALLEVTPKSLDLHLQFLNVSLADFRLHHELHTIMMRFKGGGK